MALRVLIADDDDLMRAGLRAVLSSDDSIDVVAEAADGREAISRTRALRPDVVLMDVRMPGMDGITATGEIIAVAPGARILILTTFEDDDYVFGALSAGASGFRLCLTFGGDGVSGVITVSWRGIVGSM
jgi:DNA-binding NarL/FixJ family response regulator